MLIAFAALHAEIQKREEHFSLSSSGSAMPCRSLATSHLQYSHASDATVSQIVP